MTEDAMKTNSKAINNLYFYGWVYGYKVTRAIMKAHGIRKFEERYKITMDFASLTGFGDYKTVEFERAKFSRFKILKNPFALEFYPSKVFVDHYLRGMNAGGGTLVHEKLIECIEFECAAVNGQYCLHRNISREYLDKIDQELIKSQLDIKYLEKREKELIEECGDKVEGDVVKIRGLELKPTKTK
jgi:hypothetical protein